MPLRQTLDALGVLLVRARRSAQVPLRRRLHARAGSRRRARRALQLRRCRVRPAGWSATRGSLVVGGRAHFAAERLYRRRRSVTSRVSPVPTELPA
jgi:hypothetical protein